MRICAHFSVAIDKGSCLRLIQRELKNTEKVFQDYGWFHHFACVADARSMSGRPGEVCDQKL